MPYHSATCPQCNWKQSVYVMSSYSGNPSTSVKWHCNNCSSYQTGWGHVETPKLVTTQKAKGIYALIGAGFPTVRPIGIFRVAEEIPESIKSKLVGESPIFARPCPPSPEHGFVESRNISSIEELESLRLETLAANPESEILLMPRIDARLNAIWTPSLLTVGPGHDGATAGKSTVSIPLAGKNPISQHTLNEASISKWPYVEAVYNSDGYCQLTQLRNGPVLESVHPDFIPHPVIVESVRKTAGEDLLEWAKVVKQLPASTVIWHPGGSLTDHYSVHCREHGVPIMLTRQPIVGEKLEPTPLADPDPVSMMTGVIAGSLLKLDPDTGYAGSEGPAANRDYTDAVKLILVCLHNSAALRGDYSYWLGVAVSLLIRLGSAALNGEARHADGYAQHGTDRSTQYSTYVPRSIHRHRARLSRLTHLLTYGFGDPKSKTSVGGVTWGTCGAALVPVFNAVRTLFVEQSPGSASELTSALNLAINQAHNNGWWLNKFCNKSAFDKIPTGNLMMTLRVGPMIWRAAEVREKAASMLARETARIQAWPVTEIKPLSWRSASYDIKPGSLVLKLKPATAPSYREIIIPVSVTMLNRMLKKPAEIEIVPGGVDFVVPALAAGASATRVDIWRDHQLDPAATKVTK